jgi:hypothetical protein
MSVTDPFKTEGLQIRTRQKPITENVFQSKNYDVDYRIAPKMFLGDDGSLYFQDNQNVNPIKLGDIEEAYDRIILEDNGELRFYYDDFQKYVALSQMTTNNTPITKSNAVIYSRRKLYDPGNTFSGLDLIASKYLGYAPKLDVSDDLFTDTATTKAMFWDAFYNTELRLTGETIFDTLVNRFFDGLRSGGDTTVTAEVCADDDCTLQNKRFFVDNEKIGFKPETGDPSNKIYLESTNLTILNNYFFSNLFKYNGVGKYISKIFGPMVATTTETYYDWFFVDNGYTTVADADSPVISDFVLDAETHASCDGISGVGASVGPIDLGGVGVGYVTFDVSNSTLDAVGGSPNTLSPYIGCQGDSIIGSIETSLGRISLDGSTTFEVTSSLDSLQIWFNDYDETDNTGTADIKFIYSPHFVNISDDFEIDAVGNVASSGVIGVSGVGGFVSDTEKVLVGVFGAGTLTVEYSSGNIRPDGSSLYNTTISGSPNVGYVSTNLGDLDFDSPTEFEITSQTEVRAWYEDNDNSDGEGSVTFSYTFVPDNLLLGVTPPAFDGRGVFYGTDYYPYQTILLQDISKAFSNEVFKRFVADYNTILDNNDIIVNNYFRTAPEIDTTIDFEALLDQTETKFIANKLLLKASLESVLDQVFAGEEINIINLGDYSQFTVGGKFNADNIVDVDYSIFNDVWLDIDDFNIVTPKVTNDVGISLMASLNVDVKHRTETRFEFRLFDSVANKELDRCVVQTIDYEPTGQIGSIQRDYVETYPIQLQYFGPISQIKCEEEIYNKCASETDLNVMSHVAINAEDVFSDREVDEKFSFITNRIGNLETSTGNTRGTTSGIINIETPRIYRVQWRMVVDPLVIENGHKETLSDISFNNFSVRSDLFEISLNLYSLGEVVKKKVLKQGIVTFKNETKKRVNLPLFSSSSSSSYSISLACSKNINVWYEDKTSSGFIIASEKEFDGEVTWIVNKQPEIDLDAQKDDISTVPDCLVDFIPEFSNKSNFQIFAENGYNINLLQEVIPESDVEVAQDNEETENVDQPDEFSQTFFIDPNGPFCSDECINDCPDDWFCSDLCPDADLTKSGCSCCECITSEDCPDGKVCVDGECL